MKTKLLIIYAIISGLVYYHYNTTGGYAKQPFDFTVVNKITLASRMEIVYKTLDGQYYGQSETAADYTRLNIGDQISMVLPRYRVYRDEEHFGRNLSLFLNSVLSAALAILLWAFPNFFKD